MREETKKEKRKEGLGWKWWKRGREEKLVAVVITLEGLNLGEGICCPSSY